MTRSFADRPYAMIMGRRFGSDSRSDDCRRCIRGSVAGGATLLRDQGPHERINKSLRVGPRSKLLQTNDHDEEPDLRIATSEAKASLMD